MGYNRYDDNSYRCFSAAAASVPREKLFTRTSVNAACVSGQRINVDEIKVRESRDSEKSPESLPIIVALDVTGSMGVLPERIVKEGFGTFMSQLVDRGAVKDPHVLFMGIGDAVVGDTAPCQATQFEADNVILKQLTDLFLEGAGGGNPYESYDLAWAFAARKTASDAWDKRRKRGYVFTVGDELFPERSSVSYLTRAFKMQFNGPQEKVTPEFLLEQARERYHVFHIVIGQGSFAAHRPGWVRDSWARHLGARALLLDDYNRLAELIVSAIALSEGIPYDKVATWWDQETWKTLRSALPDPGQKGNSSTA